MRKLSCLLVGLLALTALSQAAPEQDFRLVPFPKTISLEAGVFSLGSSLILEVPADQKEAFGRLLNDELRRAGLREARVRVLAYTRPAFRLAARKRPVVLPDLPSENTPESYGLEVRPR